MFERLSPEVPGENLHEWLAQLDAERRGNGDPGLPREVRESRLEIRRELEASVAHIGEDSGQKYYRERMEAKRRQFLEARERPVLVAQENQRREQAEVLVEQAHQRIDTLIHTLGANDDALHDALGEIIANLRLERAAEVEEEITRACAALTEKFEPRFAELERRAQSAVGKLPMAKVWGQDAVVNEGELFSHQAACDGRK
jgi:hypothetical protein